MIQRTNKITSFPILSFLLTVLMLCITGHTAVAAPEAETDELYYTIQIVSSNSLNGADISYNSLISQYNDSKAMIGLTEDDLNNLRIEQVDLYYTVRIGKFKDKNSARLLLDTIKETFPDAIILLTNIKPERIKQPSGEISEDPKNRVGTNPSPTETSLLAANETQSDAAGPKTVSPEPSLSKASLPAVEDSDPVAAVMKTMKPAAPLTVKPTASSADFAVKKSTPPATEPKKNVPAAIETSGDVHNTLQQNLPIEENHATPAVKDEAVPESIPTKQLASPPDEIKIADDTPPSQTRQTAAKKRNKPAGKLPVLIALLLMFGISAMQISKKKKGGIIKIDVEQKEKQAVPKLSDAMETRLIRNLRELQLFEGNVLSVDHDVKTIYMTSCFPKEGKTTTAINIAYALSQNKAVKVLLIDGNSTSPKIHSFFGTERSPGLTESLMQKKIVDGAIRETTYNNLFILPVGGQEGKSTQNTTFIESENIKLILEEVKQIFNYVVYDGHALLGSSHASIHANICDGMIVVVECERSKWEVVSQSMEQVKKRGGNILGVVLNKRKFYIPKFLYGRV